LRLDACLRYYGFLAPMASAVIPTVLGSWMFGTGYGYTFLYVVIYRYTLTLHSTWTINSIAHIYGDKPYDSTIRATECPTFWKLAVHIGLGEGFHNYHHVFPYDYKASEWGWKYNLSTAFIDMMAWCGQTYDLKSPKPTTITSAKTKCAQLKRTQTPNVHY